MQPYFMPYIGYISLLKHTDRFILFDTPQFIRHGWIERNRILKPEAGWQYIQVPLMKFSRDIAIKDVLINNSELWKSKILAQLQHYKKTAPFYYKTIGLLKTIFELETSSIVELNKRALLHICDYLNIEAQIDVLSEMNLKIEPVAAPDEWALNICKSLDNIDEYWNPPGGKSFFDKTKYDSADLVLKFHQIHITEYSQNRNNFESGLSILDLLMFKSVDDINTMLDKFELT